MTHKEKINLLNSIIKKSISDLMKVEKHCWLKRGSGNYLVDNIDNKKIFLSRYECDSCEINYCIKNLDNLNKRSYTILGKDIILSDVFKCIQKTIDYTDVSQAMHSSHTLAFIARSWHGRYLHEQSERCIDYLLDCLNEND